MVTDTCHARSYPPFDAEHRTSTTFCASSIMYYFCSMSLPWLAACIFLLTTQRITQHIYWNVFVQYNLILSHMGPGDGRWLFTARFLLKMMSSRAARQPSGFSSKWLGRWLPSTDLRQEDPCLSLSDFLSSQCKETSFLSALSESRQSIAADAVSFIGIE
jgi:hypothetical protein